MNNDSERIQKGAVVVNCNSYLPVVTWERLKKTTMKLNIRTAYLPTEIRTDHLPNTNLEPNTYSNPHLQPEVNDNLKYFISYKYTYK
jgi:hypothetical protein